MKKAISLLLFITMLCTMMTFTASAEAEYTIVKSFFSTDNGISGQFNNGTSTEVSQIMGRTAEDKSNYSTRVRTETNNGNHKVQYIISPGTEDTNYGDLLVFGASFCVQKNIGTVYLSGNGSINISQSYKIDATNNFQTGWNKIVYVYDHSTASNTLGSGNYAGSWAVYVNGKCMNEFGENRRELTADNPYDYISKGKLSQMRIVFSCSDATDIGIFLDDAYAYSVSTSDKEGFMAQFETGAPALAAASNGEYTVSGTSLVAAAGATVASVNATDGATISVYANDEYAYELASDSALEDGNTIVLSKDGIFSYYTVTNEASANNVIYSTRFSNGSYASGIVLANSGYFIADYVTGKQVREVQILLSISDVTNLSVRTQTGTETIFTHM